jgi:hypothetical protein
VVAGSITDCGRDGGCGAGVSFLNGFVNSFFIVTNDSAVVSIDVDAVKVLTVDSQSTVHGYPNERLYHHEMTSDGIPCEADSAMPRSWLKLLNDTNMSRSGHSCSSWKIYIYSERIYMTKITPQHGFPETVGPEDSLNSFLLHEAHKRNHRSRLGPRSASSIHRNCLYDTEINKLYTFRNVIHTNELPAIFLNMVQVDSISGKGISMTCGIDTPAAEFQRFFVREIPAVSLVQNAIGESTTRSN